MQDILVPTSVGELIDKVTILQIKSERITDAAKVENVRKELGALTKICEQHALPLSDELYSELLEVNKTLWKIEDDIRVKERKKEFDASFIELARAVYVCNDKRADIKKRINVARGSKYIEEKSYDKY